MRKHTVSAAATAATAALVLTACGSSNDTQPAPSAAADTTATQADTTATNGALIKKDIGETAGFGNPNDPLLTLTVDGITTSPTCTGPGGGPALDGHAEGEYLNVDMTVTTSDAMPTQLTNALSNPHWHAIDAEGVTHDSIATYDCQSDNSTLSSVHAGNTYKLNVIFDVPTGTRTLAYQNGKGGWEWSVR